MHMQHHILSVLPTASTLRPQHKGFTLNAIRHLCLQIIMDGNSRWATRQGLPAFVGHERGVAALKSAVVTAREWGIQALTVRPSNLQLPASLLHPIK
jgi:undecaprenyl pyrophosphate synthase